MRACVRAAVLRACVVLLQSRGAGCNLIRPPTPQGCMQRYTKIKPKERMGELVEKDLKKQLVPRAGAQLGSRSKVRDSVGSMG